MSFKDCRDLRSYARQFEAKLKPIKVFLLDVDGILTDGRLWWMGEEVGWNRFFHAHDGYGVKILERAGIRVGLISGGQSQGLEKRVGDLGVSFSFLGNEDKREAYLEVKKITGCEDHEILYMGDEFFDLPLLKRAGFSATVPNASLEIQESVDYVTVREGGQGAVREVIDMIRYVQGWEPEVLEFDR